MPLRSCRPAGKPSDSCGSFTLLPITSSPKAPVAAPTMYLTLSPSDAAVSDSKIATLAMFAEPDSMACMAALPLLTLMKSGSMPCAVKKPFLSATYTERLAKLPVKEVIETLTGAADPPVLAAPADDEDEELQPANATLAAIATAASGSARRRNERVLTRTFLRGDGWARCLSASWRCGSRRR